MTSQNSITEPSMDEILASIRKIIANDPQGGYQPPVIEDKKPEAEIITLTHALPDEASPPAAPPRENATSPLSKCILDELPKEAAQPKPQAFGFEIGTGGNKNANPVEDLVRQLLQPLLKEWVEVHLPALVRWTINEQVERIIRQGVGQAVPTYEATRPEKK